MNVLRSFSIYTSFSLVEKAIPFIIITLLTYYLTPSEIGILANVDISIQIYIMLILLNVDKSLFIEYFNPQYTNKYATYVSNAILLVASTAVAILLINTIIYQPVSRLMGIPIKWFIILPIIAFGRAVFNILLSLMQMRKKPYEYGFTSVSYIILNFIFGVVLISQYELKVEGLIISYLVASLCILLFAFKYIRNNFKLRFNPNMSIIKSILIIGAPLIPIRAMHLIVNTSDRLFISTYAGLEELGVYHIGYMIGSIVFLFNAIFSRAWTPHLFEYLKTKTENSEHEIVKYSMYYLVFMAILFLAVVLFGSLYFKTFAQDEYTSGFKFTPLIALSYFIYCGYQLYSQILLFYKKTNILFIIALSTIVINITLNLLLIPTMHALGAAYATLLSFIFLSTGTIITGRKIYTYKWKLIFNK